MDAKCFRRTTEMSLPLEVFLTKKDKVRALLLNYKAKVNLYFILLGTKRANFDKEINWMNLGVAQVCRLYHTTAAVLQWLQPCSNPHNQ